MQLDNEILKINDAVYHLFYGDGIVTQVTNDNATAVFSKTVIHINNNTIHTNGLKIIGLQKPLIVWEKNRTNKSENYYLPFINLLRGL
jgi:carotenoid cleavage dioxygenase-like enzyme